MKLLVLTQAIDRDDQTLGFFHRWVEMFATQATTIEAICLKKGTYALPNNVEVHSLGKEAGLSRPAYLGRLYRFVFSLSYDAVFVHMNEEYVLLCGWWWRLRGKKIILWRNHKMGSWRTRLAAHLSHAVCYTSPDAYVARYAHAVRMPIGIDTELFAPAGTASSGVLFFGRLDPVKRVELFIDAMRLVGSSADIVGSPTQGHESYAADMAKQVANVPALAIKPGVSHAQTAALYASHAVYVNLTPSGSFDKTIGEAMSSGCLVVCANEAVREVLRPEFLVALNAQSVAKGITAALALSAEERASEGYKLRSYVEREHSLMLLTKRLFFILTA